MVQIVAQKYKSGKLATENTEKDSSRDAGDTGDNNK
jgi:hypothetical protein